MAESTLLTPELAKRFARICMRMLSGTRIRALYEESPDFPEWKRLLSKVSPTERAAVRLVLATLLKSRIITFVTINDIRDKTITDLKRVNRMGDVSATFLRTVFGKYPYIKD